MSSTPTTRRHSTEAPAPELPASRQHKHDKGSPHPFATVCPRWCRTRIQHEQHLAGEKSAHRSAAVRIPLSEYPLTEEGESLVTDHAQAVIIRSFRCNEPAVLVGMPDVETLTRFTLSEVRELAAVLTRLAVIADDVDFAGEES